MAVRKRRWKKTNGEIGEAFLLDYRDASGTRRFEQFATRKQAKEREAKVTVDLKAGIHVALSRSPTVKEAAQIWLASCDHAGLERATVAAYRQHVELHIVPLIGTVKLAKITVPIVRNFESTLREKGNSDAMVKKIICSLGAIFAEAIESGSEVQNPVRNLRRKRSKGRRQAEMRGRGKLHLGEHIPATSEVAAILAAAEARWRPLLVVAAFTGLRASELRGLRWGDVELAKREITVRQRADRFNEIGAPKSKTSERTFEFGKIVANTLAAWKLAYPRPLIAGSQEREAHRPEHLVFPNGDGRVEYLQNIVNRGLVPAVIAGKVTMPVLTADGKPKLDDAGEPLTKPKYKGMHAFRHFYASWCINPKESGGLGLTPKEVQERLGHSSIVVTLDVYGHLFPRADIAERLDAAESALFA